MARAKTAKPYHHGELREALVSAGRKLLERLGATVVEGGAIVDLPELGGSRLLQASGLSLFTVCNFDGH